jgi:iron(III) transport system ATP-binding protein
MFLQLDHVSVRYPGTQGKAAAVESVSLGLQPGQIGVLIGPSGCGKTTVLRAVAGLERLHAGRISMGHELLSGTAAGVHMCRPSSAASAWCSRTTPSSRT